MVNIKVVEHFGELAQNRLELCDKVAVAVGLRVCDDWRKGKTKKTYKHQI